MRKKEREGKRTPRLTKKQMWIPERFRSKSNRNILFERLNKGFLLLSRRSQFTSRLLSSPLENRFTVVTWSSYFVSICDIKKPLHTGKRLHGLA